MRAEEREKRRRENLLERHEEWCAELRDATLKASTGAERVAARNSYAYAAKAKARTCHDAEAKLETFGRIHAWASSGRVGAPKRYRVEGHQIAHCFMHGIPWEACCA